MLISVMREKVRSAYPGYSWERRVDMMDNRQIFAIYMSMLRKGKFDKPKNSRSKQQYEVCHQMTLFEYPDFNN